MSIEHKPLSPLRRRMIEAMRLRKLAEKTQSHYIRWVKGFTRFLGRSPDMATAEDARRHQLHLSDTGVSRISLNAAVTALRFFFEVTLGRSELMAKILAVITGLLARARSRHPVYFSSSVPAPVSSGIGA
jgi:integrase/recombinase XerD